MTIIDAVERQAGVTVEQVLGDTSYGTADNRAACTAREIALVSPLPEASDPAVAKSAFVLDLETPSATCPGGHTTTTAHAARDDQGRPVLRFHFPRAVCEACALFARCVRSQTDGRTITSHYTCTIAHLRCRRQTTGRQVRCHEALLQAARAQQATAEFKDTYRKRAAVERKTRTCSAVGAGVADLVAHGLRRARYLRRVKVRLQNYWVGALVNLKRLFGLFQGNTRQMRHVLASLHRA